MVILSRADRQAQNLFPFHMLASRRLAEARRHGMKRDEALRLATKGYEGLAKAQA